MRRFKLWNKNGHQDFSKQCDAKISSATTMPSGRLPGQAADEHEDHVDEHPSIGDGHLDLPLTNP
jgi:hypothetical protein